MEISFTTLRDGFPNPDEIRLDRHERLSLASKKYRASEKGQNALAERNDFLKETYRTDEEFRDKRLAYQKQYTADGRQAAVRQKYKASEKGQMKEAEYRASEARAEYLADYRKSDKNKAAQKKYAESEKGKEAAKRKQAKYREKKKAEREASSC